MFDHSFFRYCDLISFQKISKPLTLAYVHINKFSNLEFARPCFEVAITAMAHVAASSPLLYILALAPLKLRKKSIILLTFLKQFDCSALEKLPWKMHAGPTFLILAFGIKGQRPKYYNFRNRCVYVSFFCYIAS